MWNYLPNKKKSNAAKQFAEAYLGSLGFSIAQKIGIGDWQTTARGVMDGCDVIVCWEWFAGGGSGNPRVKRTDVIVGAPALPLDFGLEVGPVVREKTKEEYPFSTGNEAFDKVFAGWTDRRQLSAALINDQAQADLLELSSEWAIRLSILTGSYFSKNAGASTGDSREIRITAQGYCFDREVLDTMLRIGRNMAQAAERKGLSGE